MGRSIGLQSSKMCTAEVKAFLDCQKQNSFVDRICGVCNWQRDVMDACLDREVCPRRGHC